MEKQGFTTMSLHVPFQRKDPHNSLQIPLYESVAFEFETAEQMEANFKGQYQAHVYSRTSSPTLEYFEMKMKTLTGCFGVLGVSSGMAAITNTILAVAKSGDNLIAVNKLFGHTYALLEKTLPEFGITTRFSELKNEAETENLIDKNTRAIYFETVTNPQLEIADIEMLVRIAKRKNILLICDSTMTPPNVFRGGKWGINIEVISATKYISGGATAFGGVIIDHGNFDWEKNPHTCLYSKLFGQNAFMASLRKNIFRNTGSGMSPQTAKLLAQGLDILEIRVERCFVNCLEICEYLKSAPKVKHIIYPALPENKSFAEAKKYFEGIPGTIVCFDLHSKKECFAFMNHLKTIRRATNLNDNKSLIIHPYSTIYSEFSGQQLIEAGIRDTMLRLSVGIENAKDLIADIHQALDKI